MRKNYTMTTKQYESLLKACRSVPMIMLKCGTPSSPQENANAAWQRLGNEMGFVWDTVRPDGADPKNFSAEEII